MAHTAVDDDGRSATCWTRAGQDGRRAAPHAPRSAGAKLDRYDLVLLDVMMRGRTGSGCAAPSAAR
ncbi:MAG: hypothetical protein ACLR3C_15390 [Eggerthella lenta]